VNVKAKYPQIEDSYLQANRDLLKYEMTQHRFGLLSLSLLCLTQTDAFKFLSLALDIVVRMNVIPPSASHVAGTSLVNLLLGSHPNCTDLIFKKGTESEG
jgi:hypothetical protein